MRIHEIFTSIEGEVSAWHQGGFTVFIRLQGCNLKCSYCDTPESRKMSDGEERSISQIVKSVKQFQGPYTTPRLRRVTITGGEPLLQETELLQLIDELLKEEYLINVETNGSIEIPYLYKRKKGLAWVVDYKLHNKEKMVDSNFTDLPSQNWMKFLIGGEEDLEEALLLKSEFKRNPDCQGKVAFSPIMGEGRYLSRCSLILQYLKQRNQWNVFLNVQLHKILGVP